jgi:hypothetical protein
VLLGEHELQTLDDLLLAQVLLLALLLLLLLLLAFRIDVLYFLTVQCSTVQCSAVHPQNKKTIHIYKRVCHAIIQGQGESKTD